MSRKNWVAIAIGTILVALMVVGCWPGNRMSNQVLENNGHAIAVMPLGDSITKGPYTPGGYRLPLWQMLVEEDGYAIDLVGSLQDGPPELPDRDHEGHSGWRIDQIRKRIAGWLRRSQPEVVVLLIGTNDMAQGYQLDTAAQRWLALIRDIHQQQPQTSILVGSLPPLEDPTLNERVEAFNVAIADLAARERSNNVPLTFVDIYDYVSVDQLADGIHPNREGYRQIATAWRSPLAEILDRQPNTPEENAARFFQ